MAGICRQLGAVTALGLVVAGGWFDTAARGQGAVAFQPTIGFIPIGSTLTVTPVVSADRRYVRLTLSPFFNSFNGFTPFSTQLAAVGGIGGAGGFAGMNGVIAADGFGGAGVGMESGAASSQGGSFFAGNGAFGGFPFPAGEGGGFGGGGLPPFMGPMGPGTAAGPNAWPGAEPVRDGPWPWDPPAFSATDDGRAVRAARPARGHRPAARKPTRRPRAAAGRRGAAAQPAPGP
jgi:hypothetical protein